MSRQFNYFARDDDTKVVAEVLMKTIEDLHVVKERGTKADLEPRPVLDPGDLLPSNVQDKVYLVSRDFVSNIILSTLEEGGYFLEYQEFPCVEYQPSRGVDEEVTALGRIAYFYRGPTDFSWIVDRMFRALKRQAVVVPGTRVFWIFPCAARNSRTLDFEGGWRFGREGLRRPNPLFETG